MYINSIIYSCNYIITYMYHFNICSFFVCSYYRVKIVHLLVVLASILDDSTCQSIRSAILL